MEWAVAATGWVLAPIINALDDQRKRYFKKRAVKNALRSAIERAFAAFAVSHPDWVRDRYFDRTFLENSAAPLLATFLNRGRVVTADELVDAWSEYRVPADRTQAVGVAADFLRLFQGAVRNLDALQDLVDRQVADRKLEAAEQTAELLEEIAGATDDLRNLLRQQNIEVGLDLLSEAAHCYLSIARNYKLGTDLGDALLAPRTLVRQGTRKLRRAAHPAVTELLDTFNRLVVEPFNTVVAAQDADTDAIDAIKALSDGVMRFDDQL